MKRIGKFTGKGTVFSSDIINISNISENLSPFDLIETLKQHLNHVTSIIEKNKGNILQFEGNAVLAFWHPQNMNPNHSQLAFDTSCEIISTLPTLFTSQKHFVYDMDIVLGTGEMSGDFFGPAKAFQVVGKAMSIVNRLNKIPNRKGSLIRMTQFTMELLDIKDKVSKLGIIKRDNLEDLEVYAYNAANPLL